jgi:nicotinate-nucleotide adenylyltransferase
MSCDSPLGIFGGTFDPIHFGHIEPVIEAAKQVNIEKIALMPCHIPTHKIVSKTSSHHRLEMVKLICQQYPIFYPDDREIKRGIPTYSIDSIREFRQQHPKRSLCFFIGMDSLLTINKWYQWQELFGLCHFVVCQRPGHDTEFSPEIVRLLQDRQVTDPSELHLTPSGKIYIAETIKIAISSTNLRQRLQANLPVDKLVPKSVINYIQQYKLYQD